jgi:1-acyl-sn-glycerol-3-phosphate acyltransferase
MQSQFERPGWAAAVWLLLLLLMAGWYLVNVLRRSPYSLWENVLYLPTYLYGRLMWNVHFLNSPPPEMASGAILVANHRSSVDPFFVQLSAGRRVHWMVAREYCENPITGPILRAVQVIPTNRSGMDTKATKWAIRLAREGRLVGMFPEGRLNHTRDPLVSIRSGAALVAIRAGVPILPLYIHGSPYRREVWSPLIMPAQVRITFGQPIDPRAPLHEATSAELSAADSHATAAGEKPADEKPSRQDELVLAEQMIIAWGKQIVALAGHPDWPIELAGRSRLAQRRPGGADGTLSG